jgi:hypothetical protein
MTTLAYPPTRPRCPPQYLRLYEPSRWEDLVTLFRKVGEQQQWVYVEGGGGGMWKGGGCASNSRSILYLMLCAGYCVPLVVDHRALS